MYILCRFTFTITINLIFREFWLQDLSYIWNFVTAPPSIHQSVYLIWLHHLPCWPQSSQYLFPKSTSQFPCNLDWLIDSFCWHILTSRFYIVPQSVALFVCSTVRQNLCPPVLSWANCLVEIIFGWQAVTVCQRLVLRVLELLNCLFSFL